MLPLFCSSLELPPEAMTGATLAQSTDQDHGKRCQTRSLQRSSSNGPEPPTGNIHSSEDSRPCPGWSAPPFHLTGVLAGKQPGGRENPECSLIPVWQEVKLPQKGPGSGGLEPTPASQSQSTQSTPPRGVLHRRC